MNAPHADDTEATLRDALTARADAVEPEDTDFAAVEGRADVLRTTAGRHRVVLAAAAALVVVLGLVGALAIGSGGDDDRAELATDAGPPATSDETTEPTETTADRTPSAIDGDPDRPTIWPLPTMSISYPDPQAAALAFVQHYLGFTGGFCVTSTTGATVHLISEGVCGGGTGAAEPFGPSMAVHVTNTPQGWAVVGATSDMFSATLEDGFLSFVADSPITVQVRPLGGLDVASEMVADPSGVSLVNATDDPAVVTVTDGSTATLFIMDGQQ